MSIRFPPVAELILIVAVIVAAVVIGQSVYELLFPSNLPPLQDWL